MEYCGLNMVTVRGGSRIFGRRGGAQHCQYSRTSLILIPRYEDSLNRPKFCIIEAMQLAFEVYKSLRNSYGFH